MSITGGGMVLGSLLMSALGSPKKCVRGIILSAIVGAFGIIVAGLTSYIIVITSALTITLFTASTLNASNRTLWQSKIEKEYQGRIMSLRRMIQMLFMPLSILLAGPLADQVFEPLMAENGALSQSIGKIIGVGEGRGIGLIYIIIGLIWIFVSLIVYANKHVRALDVYEDEIDDDNPILNENQLAT